MFNLNQKGVIHLLVPLILLLGIGVGVYLVVTGNLKLFSKATNPPIVFKAIDGSSLPTNSSGIPQSTSATVQIELTSTLGPPLTPSPSPTTSQTSSPPSDSNEGSDNGSDVEGVYIVQEDGSGEESGGESQEVDTDSSGTVSYKIAENPTDLNTALDTPYSQHPTTIDYTFKDSSLGSKFIWVEFKDSTGKTDRRSAQIEIVSATPSPTPTPSPSSGKTPACEIYGDMNLDGSVDSKDVLLASKVASGEIIPSSSVAGGDTQHMRSVGDVNSDNKVDSQDVNLISRYIDGLDTTFPVCQSAKSSPCGSLGDVTTDGKVSSLDAYEVLRISAGFKDSLYTKKLFTDDQRTRADVDGNGNVTSTDALRISRYLLGRDVTFKACPQVFCPPGQISDGEKCVPIPQPTTVPSSPNPSPSPSPSSGPAKISVNPTIVVDNGILRIEWSGITNPHKYDFINLIRDGGLTNFYINSGTTDCLAGAQDVPSSIQPKESGSCNLNLSKVLDFGKPLSGSYYFDLYRAPDVGAAKLATSNKFTVVRPSSITPIPSSSSYNRVFVTSWEYNGNLGGVNGADSKCQGRANASLSEGRTWKAWISDRATPARQRLSQSSIPYKLLDGKTVASNWADLTDQTLQNSIKVTENMLSIPQIQTWDVWTNTTPEGNIYDTPPDSTCNGWASNSATQRAYGGSTQKTDWQWSSALNLGAQLHTCDTLAKLYCFEQ